MTQFIGKFSNIFDKPAIFFANMGEDFLPKIPGWEFSEARYIDYAAFLLIHRLNDSTLWVSGS